MDIAQILARRFEETRKSTVKRVLQCENLEIKLTDSSMTFRDICMHLVTSDKALIQGLATGQISKNIGLPNCSSGENNENLVHLLSSGIQEVIVAIKKMNPVALLTIDRIVGKTQVSTFEAVLIFMDHEAHHRGQLQALLSTGPVAPPL